MVEKPVTPFSSWRRWGTAGWLLFLIATAVGLFVGHVGGEQRGWVAGFLTGALVAAIRVSWPVRHELWFWATVAAFVSVDALAIAFVDWSFTEKWNGHTFAGLATLDVGAMLAIVYGLYRLNYGRPAEPIEEDPADLPDYADRDQDI